MSSIALGLSFGDEGKGITTSFLCSRYKRPLVVRFNGGHQAGHTVVYKDQKHVFSHFGSGTLQGAATFWSQDCTFSPLCFLEECKELIKKGLTPEFYVDPLCPVTTHFDMSANHEHEKLYEHGSVGVGFGKTHQRQQDFYKLYVQDLFFESVLRQKLNHIRDYYKAFHLDKSLIENFIETVRDVKELIIVKTFQDTVVSNFSNPKKGSFDGYVYEGAQGILLDQDFGFFPNVTRSNTTQKNLKHDWNWMFSGDETYYITRTYQTRHGNGYMTNEKFGELDLKNSKDETNIPNEWQGVFRKSILDLEFLKYSLMCDSNFCNPEKRNLVITCVDQTGEDFYVTDAKNTNPFKINIEDLPRMLGVKFKEVLFSTGPSMENMKSLTKQLA
jgi:adenylosuccinate synthase